jgi:hypothetical protein
MIDVSAEDGKKKNRILDPGSWLKAETMQKPRLEIRDSIKEKADPW